MEITPGILIIGILTVIFFPVLLIVFTPRRSKPVPPPAPGQILETKGNPPRISPGLKRPPRSEPCPKFNRPQ